MPQSLEYPNFYFMRLDLTDNKYGRLLAVTFNSQFNKWECVCDCGNIKYVSCSSLRSGSTKSCGCLDHETKINNNLRKHGYTAAGVKSRTYKTWSGLKTRCYNPNNKGHENYGAKGVGICDRWLNSFENFLEDMGERPIGKTLDRYPNMNGNYEPSNCRWATPKQQGENTRKSRVFEHNGISMNVSDWAKHFNTHRSNILKHLKKGRTIEQLVRFYEYKKHNNIRSKPFVFD